jgi:hypothetical protein
VTEHYNGTSWSIVAAPQPLQMSELSAVAPVSASNVWAVGSGSTPTASGPPLVEHYNGTAWSVVPTSMTTAGLLHSVTAISAANVWAVGSQPATGSVTRAGLAMHYDGTAWTQVTLPAPAVPAGGQWNLYGVRATSASDVWAVGYLASADGLVNHAIVEHFNGTSWSVTQAPDLGPSYPINNIVTVHANSPSDVWAAGTSATSNGQFTTLIEHFNGTSWQVAAAPSSGSSVLDVSALAGTGTGQLWAVGSLRAAGSSNEQTLTARQG